MNWLAILMARRAAGQYLGNLAESAAQGRLTLLGWRKLVAHAAQKGDLDALFKVYVGPARAKAQAFIDGE